MLGPVTFLFLLYLALGRLLVVQHSADSFVQRVREQLGLLVVVHRSVVLQRHGHGQVLTERVPAQMALLLQLLHVLGRRAAWGEMKKREINDGLVRVFFLSGRWVSCQNYACNFLFSFFFLTIIKVLLWQN